MLAALIPGRADAKPAPGGNNGTVKVDGGDLQGHDNEPHVGCSFFVEWFGFDEGTRTTTVTFDAQPPTGNTELLTDTFTFTGHGSGNTRDTFKQYDLSSALEGFTPHPKQGFHVKLTVETDGSKGNDVKHKVFWVKGCFAPTVTATACSGPGGTSGITLTIKNNDADQTFTVDQDGTTQTVDIDAGDTATLHLPQPAGDSTITVTSGANPDISVTKVVDATSCEQPPPETAIITLDKVLAGDGAPQDDPTFEFTVACDGQGAQVTSPVDIKASDVAKTVATDVPLNTKCTITETITNGADATSFTVDGGAPQNGTSVDVTPTSATTVAVVATNTFNPPPPDTTTIKLAKVLAGADAPQDDPTFEFTLACDGQGAQVTSPVDIKASDAAKTVATDVPLNTKCTITETDTHAADHVAYAIDNGQPQNGLSVDVTPTSTSTVNVVATNTYDPAPPPDTGSITLDKVLAGNSAPSNDPTFVFTVSCAGQGAVVTSPVNVKASNPAVTVASAVPLNTSCTITETGTNSASSTSFTVGGGAPQNGTSVQVTPTSTTPVAVVATNTFTTAVAGNEITQNPTQVAGTELARTGFDPRPLLAFGMSMLGTGALLLLFGRRLSALLMP